VARQSRNFKFQISDFKLTGLSTLQINKNFQLFNDQSTNQLINQK